MIPTFQLGGMGLSRLAGGIELVRANALHAAVAFARSTTGTYFDAAKVMQVAAIDAPRFEYDGVSGAYLGLLIEPQRTNNFLSSAAIDEATWTKTRASAVANQAVAPDGTLSVDYIIENTSGGTTHLVTRNNPFAAGQRYTRSAFVGPAGRTWLCYAIGSAALTGNGNVWYNTATGALGQVSASVVPLISGPFQGLYRCASSFTATGTTAGASANVNIADVDTNFSYTGDGVSGLAVWGQQIEDDDGRSRPTSYIPTTTVAVTRSSDSATFPVSAIDATAGTFVFEHDCPSGDVLLGDGATARLVSQGPGKIAFAYDGSGTMVVFNGGAGSTAAAVTLGATLRILGSSAAQAIGHCKALTWYAGKQTEAWMQGKTT